MFKKDSILEMILHFQQLPTIINICFSFLHWKFRSMFEVSKNLTVSFPCFSKAPGETKWILSVLGIVWCQNSLAKGKCVKVNRSSLVLDQRELILRNDSFSGTFVCLIVRARTCKSQIMDILTWDFGFSDSSTVFDKVLDLKSSERALLS